MPETLPQVLVNLRQAVSGGLLVRALNRAGVRVRDYIKTTHMGAATTGEKRLARNTGKMERATVALPATVESPGSAAVVVRIGVPYASLHFTDTGKRETIITPVRAKALTIPILKNAQGRAPQSARAYPNTTIKRGVLFAVTRTGQIPIFSLRSSVKVPVRVDMQRDVHPTAEKILKEEVERLLGDVL